jgi:hypothetical protein
VHPTRRELDRSRGLLIAYSDAQKRKNRRDSTAANTVLINNYLAPFLKSCGNDARFVVYYNDPLLLVIRYWSVQRDTTLILDALFFRKLVSMPVTRNRAVRLFGVPVICASCFNFYSLRCVWRYIPLKKAAVGTLRKYCFKKF